MLYLIKLIFGHSLMLCKSSDKGRQRTLEFFLNQFIDLTRLGFIFGNERSNSAIVVLQHTTLSKTLDNGISRSPFPSELILAQLYKLDSSNRLMLPHNQAKPILTFVNLRKIHIHALHVYTVRLHR